MKKKRKWLKWLIFLIVIAVCAGLWFFSRETKSAAYNEVEVTQGDLTTYYNFDGLVHAPRIQTLTSGEAGTVRTVYVSQNQQVRKGDRIYRLEGGDTVEADIDGEVTGLYIEEGDVISAGEKAAQIIDMSRLEIHLDVDEYDVSAVVPGTEAMITVLATDREFTAQISAIDKNGTAAGDLSYYTATAPMGEVEGAYPGMQVSAKVLREHVEDAALLRVDALQFDAYNKPYVLMGTPEDPRQVPVTVGVSDGIYCEIREGVKPGDVVLQQSGMGMAELMAQMRANSPLLN